MSEIEYTDRYQALSIPEPDPSTMCTGACEGTGVVPIFVSRRLPAVLPGKATLELESETDPTYRALWEVAEQAHPSKDGWHFVTCLDCHGTGRRAGGPDE